MIDMTGLPPEPWTPARTYEQGWGFTVIDATGANIGASEVWAEDAALMAVIHAFGPRLLRYVASAADKGGVEAKTLIADFERARTEINMSPEKVTALRRGRAA